MLGRALGARSLNLGNDKPLKPEILHTLKATQNKSFKATTVNIKDFFHGWIFILLKKMLSASPKMAKFWNSGSIAKIEFFLYWFHQIGIKELHTKFKVINFIFTGVMTFLIFSKFAPTPRACPKIRDKNTQYPFSHALMLEMVRYSIKWKVKKFRQIWLSARKMTAV